MNQALLDVAVGVALVVAAVGIVVPVLPGTALALVALLVWAILTGGTTAWLVFGIGAVLMGLGLILKYLLPHRSMRASGVPNRSIVVGFVAAIIGFIVIPVVGVLVGFLGGVYAAEQVRLGDWEEARASTWVAMKATGFSILIELAALLITASFWGAAVVTG